MVYLLALIIPMTLLFSPKVEKSGSVFFAKSLTITQERRSPAYDLFRQAQKIIQPNVIKKNLAETQPSVVNLNSEGRLADKPVYKTVELVIDQKELLVQTERALYTLATQQQDSSLFTHLASSNNLEPQFSGAQPQSQSQAATIRGNFELSEGVGIVDHIVSLRRVFEGQSIELGEVDLKAGMYQILVGSFEGELVAEIKDRSGLIIGEDRQKILGLKRAGLFFSGPLLKVGQPTTFGLNLRNVDDRKLIETDLTASLFSGNLSLKKTTDNYPNVASLSSTIGLITDKSEKTARTLSIRTAKDNSETLLFSQKWVDGLKTYLSEKLQIQYQTSAGMIIGRILQDGKPVAGAQVVVENQPGLEPYYLDQFLIPQTEQTTTSSNGFFVIPGINTGRYNISAFIKDRPIGSQIYFADENIVSYQEILSTIRTQSVVVRTFDGFTGEEMDADLILPGHEDIFSVVDGIGRYRTSAVAGIQEIQVRPANSAYTSYIYLQNTKKDHVHLPLIQDAFLDQIRIQKQIPLLPEASTFIGFAPTGEFDLHLTVENFDQRQIVYFDPQGVLTAAPVKGGGFIIYNLPEGLQEIILQDQKNDRTFSQVLYSESTKNYVAHFVE